MIGQLRSAPNLLTLLRLVFIPFAVIAVLGGHYGWALVIFVVAGISDGLDGLLARLLEQKTTLGQYLDPIADKLLLSTMFLVLSATHKINWGVTVLVFSRDAIIVIICTLLYATSAMKIFRPSWLGKANTVAQILTVLLVLLHEIRSDSWIAWGRRQGLNATIALTIFSGVHYIVRVALDLRHHAAESKSAESGK
jgi:cardiolipin synthase